MKIILFFVMILLFIGCGTVESNYEQADETVNKSSTIQKVRKATNNLPMVGILVNYNNQKIVSSDEVWSSKLFGENEGELNDYYLEASNNNFKFKKVMENSGYVDDGIISVYLDKVHPDMDVDNYMFENKVYGDLKVALQKADTYINFSDYDTDGSGSITPDELIVVFIIAGYEDAYEGRHVRNGIWGHQNCMGSSENTPILDGVSVMGCAKSGNFALFGEKHNRSKPHNATIGIIAHELGHATFDLPDLYNTYDPNSGGIGYFGIMGSGTWSRKNSNEYAGQTPTHFTAWSKIYNGWITPDETSSSNVLYATSSSDYNIIKIKIDAQRYYLLENRANSGYDKGLNSLDGDFIGGIAIWKIDESKTTSSNIKNNNVNADTNNKGVDLVEAVDCGIDKFGSGGCASALFYEGNVDHFLSLVSNISQPENIMGLNITK